VTASFGVTEVQPGDTPETMLRRADRALLMAKEQGRNMVVQLGTGTESSDAQSAPPGPAAPNAPFSLERDLITLVPLWVTVEKLRGFAADHQAKVVKVDGNHVQLLVRAESPKRLRRFTDRPTAFRIEVTLAEEPNATRLHVKVAPEKNRERRREEMAQRAREIFVSFRSYLMASEEGDSAPNGS
jgi:hypothetical protein